YYENLNDDEIVAHSLMQKRIILTKDRGLLKNKSVTHGYWIRANDPKQQLIEVFQRFDLADKIQFLIRCLICNSKLKKVSKTELDLTLKKEAAKFYDDFFLCPLCNKIYWQGSHYRNMEQLIALIVKALK